MPKDRRLYGSFTLDFPESHKIMPLSDSAFRCLVEATLWSRKQLTDGLLPSRYAVARWGVEVLQELATNDPSSPSLVEVESGWLIHDFAEHQDTKEVVEARSKQNKLNGQKGGLAKSKRTAKRVASKSVSEVVAETETETETYRGGGASTDEPIDPSPTTPPPPRCPTHLNDSRPPNCGRCKDARLASERWHAEHGAAATTLAEAERAEAVAARTACPDCDSEGWVLDGDGTTAVPARRCDHAAIRDPVRSG